MAGTWWVAKQDRSTGVAYVVVQSGNDQFPSGVLPSISYAAGPYPTRAAAQAEANVLAGTPGSAVGTPTAGVQTKVGPYTTGSSGYQIWVSEALSATDAANLANADSLTGGGQLWFAFHGSGQAYLANEAYFPGAHGYPTLEQAVGNSNDSNLFNTATAAGANVNSGTSQSAVKKVNITTYNDQASIGQSPTGPNRRIIIGVSGIEAPAVSLGNVFSLSGGPFSANFWIRAGEVILGLILVAIGVAKLTGTPNVLNKLPGVKL